jgi:acyl-lipid omega-6 desaturase (Delta-12 desaturase)
MSARRQPRDSSTRTAREWHGIVATYARPDTRRGLLQAGPTLLLWGLAWAGAAWLFNAVGWWAALPATLVVTVPMVRLSVLQHDCAHRTLLATPRANIWMGRLLSLVNTVPLELWRRSHVVHHATNGLLDRRGVGDVPTLTLDEYRASTPAQRIGYRLLRNGFVLMFVASPLYFTVLMHQPFAFHAASVRGRPATLSVLGTNLGLLAFWGVVVGLVGWQTVLFVQGVSLLWTFASAAFLFYMQHQFEHTSWRWAEDWDVLDASFDASSFYQLSSLGHWITANIGYHHLHHLCHRVPNYRLPEIVADHPELAHGKHVGFWESVGTMRLAIWDERSERLISFAEAGRRGTQPVAPPRPPTGGAPPSRAG